MYMWVLALAAHIQKWENKTYVWFPRIDKHSKGKTKQGEIIETRCYFGSRSGDRLVRKASLRHWPLGTDWNVTSRAKTWRKRVSGTGGTGMHNYMPVMNAIQCHTGFYSISIITRRWTVVRSLGRSYLSRNLLKQPVGINTKWTNEWQ